MPRDTGNTNTYFRRVKEYVFKSPRKSVVIPWDTWKLCRRDTWKLCRMDLRILSLTVLLLLKKLKLETEDEKE